MYLLALETGFGKFSLSLFKGEKAFGHYFCKKENEQAELLIPAIEKLLQKHKLSYQDLNFIAVGIGPGSFTGLRTGLAAAKGLSLATGAKLIGVSSLEASAFRQRGGKVYLNAQRGEAYFQEFDRDLKPLSEPILVNYEGKFSPLPDAEAIAQIALKNLGRDLPLAALYIRKPDAKFKTRAATANDLKWLAEVHAQAFSAPWNETMIATALEKMECLIAENLGFIIYEITGAECEIKTIAVLPAARGKGVGNFLSQQALKSLEVKQVAKIFLEVEENNLPALKLYKNLGFKPLSTRKDYYGPGRHALNMQLAFKA